MHPLQNKHVDNITYCGNEPFKGMYVEQVIRGRDSVFDEMCQDLNINDYRDIRAANMGKKTITKDKLAGWLEHASTRFFTQGGAKAPLVFYKVGPFETKRGPHFLSLDERISEFCNCNIEKR